MAKSSAAMPICFTPAAIRRRGIPQRARCWSSAIPAVSMRTRCSAGRVRSASVSPARSPIRRLSWMERRSWAKPARSSGRPYANWLTSISQTVLLGGLLQRRNPGQDDLDSRAAAGLGIEVEAPAQTVSHDTVDDVQAESGAALITARREERIERAAPDVEGHAATIVGKNDFDIVLAGFPHLDIDRAGLAVGKGVGHRIEEQGGGDLCVRPGIAVH